MRVSIAYNKEKKGIEIIFVPKLSNKKLEAYLIDLGFKKSNSKADMWYVADRPSYSKYIKSLQKAFNEGIDPLSIKIEPSYDAVKTNIDHYQFSLVTIEIDDEDKGIEYVIFDDLKKTALDIATRFVKSKYGNKLNSVSVSPRNFKVRARNAFDEGRIITGISENKEVQEETIETTKENSVSPIPESLTNDSGVYTKETAGDRYEILTIPFPKSTKFEAEIRVVRNEKEQFVIGIKVVNAIGGHSGYSYAPSKKDDVYPSKEIAIKTAIEKILEEIKTHNNDGVGNSDKDKTAFHKVSTHIYEFAKNQGIQLAKKTLSLPNKKAEVIKKTLENRTEEIVIPIPEDAEYKASVTIVQDKNVSTEQKAPNTLNENVDQIVNELRELETDVDDKGIAFKIGNAKIELDETLKTTQGKPLIDELKKYHHSLIEITDTIPKGKYKTRLFTISEKLGSKIGIEVLPGEEIESTEKREVLTTTADIIRYDQKTPNVLIPKGIIPPFDSGGFYVQDAKKIQKLAPHLLKASDDNLSELPAKTMFELSQMAHPDDFGFSVHRSALLREWERRGWFLFDELGYPTDLDYPYVNINVGYKSVSPLGKLIKVTEDKWWSVVEQSRPIADMQTALQFIDKEIVLLTKERDAFTNPKTGKPKSKKEDRERYNSLSYEIQSLKESQFIIEEYFDSTQQDTSHDAEPESVQQISEKKPIEKEKKDLFLNIILPGRVIPPFDKGSIEPEEALKLKEQFFYLFEYTYRNVHWASPVELFMLLQFTDLKQSGISIKKETLYRIWEKEGYSLFSQLAYPTDPKYPYVSITKGFLEVLPLEVIISKLPDMTIWWSAVKHYRPIADVSRAIKNITEQQNILAKKFEKYADAENKLDQTISGSNEKPHNLSSDITLLRYSRNHLEAYLKSIPKSDKKDKKLSDEDIRLIPPDEANRIRRQFIKHGFPMVFTGEQAFAENNTIFELRYRYELNLFELEEKTEKEFDKWIATLEKEIKKLLGKDDEKSKRSRKHREERILALKKEARELNELFKKENEVFREELFSEFVVKAKAYGHVLKRDEIASFRDFVMENLFQGRLPENYPDESISKIAGVIIHEYFATIEFEKEVTSLSSDYLDKVIAIMHDHYMEAKRLTKKQVESIKEQADVPNMGMLWEAVELSWLLWYKFYYLEPVSFENRLGAMIRFWNTVQPTYEYSDSSKELYKQYSTPCLIGAMVAEYTLMSNATRIFEPSAGNGLLVLGADPKITHVNEIDNSRRKSLEFQGFKTITHFNAAEPFPKELTASFDVVVTNPPFASWDADDFDKKRIVDNYFNQYRRLEKGRLRLEHVMSGLALHTLKDSGKAALIIMGHLYFDDRGYIAKARPFFNWLYMHYRVDDVINLNGFTLYNKQGAVAKTMLILIGGRKRNPTNKSIAPTRKQATSLDVVIDTFEEVWARIKSHIKTPIEILIQKLKIENGYDIL